MSPTSTYGTMTTAQQNMSPVSKAASSRVDEVHCNAIWCVSGVNPSPRGESKFLSQMMQIGFGPIALKGIVFTSTKTMQLFARAVGRRLQKMPMLGLSRSGGQE
ncbi:hypothetical protein HYE67_011189 [Fusarium culmorum]|uniref:Uncharacterized protein n=1 Tax=Fusarium culmorum TaxID=5516 RepID=A0A7S8DHZ9_FUSCU|nr:hypothetical protein HYE67_011189 [Fusarium culmorum]